MEQTNLRMGDVKWVWMGLRGHSAGTLGPQLRREVNAFSTLCCAWNIPEQRWTLLILSSL
jgi:hypothetical protein